MQYRGSPSKTGKEGFPQRLLQPSAETFSATQARGERGPNFSTSSGGGIYANAGPTKLFNVTITGNIANSDSTGIGVGGGVIVASGATLTFLNSIIALNVNVIDTGGPFGIAGRGALIFTDSPIAQGSTPVRRVHIQQLRDAVLFLESN